jgi:hypothetical protein
MNPQMASFYMIITDSIKRKAFSKEYFEQVIAKWNLNGWLTEEETTNALALLEEVFAEPVE